MYSFKDIFLKIFPSRLALTLAAFGGSPDALLLFRLPPIFSILASGLMHTHMHTRYTYKHTHTCAHRTHISVSIVF